MTSFHESILLIDRNPDIPLGPFDGKVAAILTDFVCTSPNQDRIYLPPMQKREVHLRADFRYGPDDPTLWPQPWVPEYPHLGSIPRKPADCSDPLSIMWWDPTRKEFDSYDGGVVDGMGELLKSKFLEFETMKKNLEDRIEEYKKTAAKPNAFLLLMVKAMQDACVRLGSLKTTFTEMRFGVTEFQRYYLEVYGLLDYLELYKPRMDGQRPPATTVAHCVGAFTSIARTAQDFYSAGLPIWFIRPQKSWDSPISCNILEIVSPLNPASSLCVSEHDPPFLPIFRGSATIHEKHGAIHTYSRQWLAFKDPFQAEPSKGSSPLAIRSVGPEKVAQHSQPTAQGSSSSKPQNIQTGDRDKFLPLESHFAPFSIPAWQDALQAVNRSSPLIETHKTSAHFGHYVFPDPGLFISPTTDEKKSRYIESWLKTRDAWLMRLQTEPSLAMSSQHWRTLLSMDVSVPVQGSTKAAKRRQDVLDMLLPSSSTYSEVQTRSTAKELLVWQGKEYPLGVLPPEDVVRQILWELYELNFIHELQSLDRRACADLDLSNTVQLLERQMKISRCFPINSFRHVTIPSENCGLAADDLNERFPFVVELLHVLKSWRGDKPAIFGISMDNLRDSTRQARILLEKTIAKYYCQQFFNYFGRAAQIPHRLFAIN